MSFEDEDRTQSSLAGDKSRNAQIVGGVGSQIRKEHDVLHGVVHYFHRPAGVSRTLGGGMEFNGISIYLNRIARLTQSCVPSV